MKMTFRDVVLPAKLTLIDHQGFMEYAKKQGDLSYDLAKRIADQGFIRCFNMGVGMQGELLLNSDLFHMGQEIGINEEELKFFTVQKGI